MKGKKILSLMLAVMLVLGALPVGLSFTAFADEIVFFEVGSVEDWNSLADYIDSHSDHENVYYDIKLTADIGPVTRMCNGRFGGSFDGQGHTITADISVDGQAALFLPQGSFDVSNLTVAGTIAGTDEHTAALIGVGYNNTISNVRVTANVISSADKIGGLIGSTYFYTGIVIENCEFAGTILKTGDPAHMIGGFCGYFNDSNPSCTVTNSVFSGSYTNAKNFSTLGFYDTEDNPVGSVPCTNSFTNTPNVLDGLNWYEQALTGMNIAKAAVTNGNTTTYYETFGAAKSAWGDQTELVLLDDAAVTDVLSVSGTRSLDLHGHGLLQTADKSVLNVTDSSLTIRDSVPTTLHRITLNDSSRGVAAAVGHADAETDKLKNVTGGYITGGCAEKGGGVFVKNATLTMAGGTVIGNVADSAGGGVDAAIGTTMNLQGGAILNNAAGFNGRYGIGGGVIVGNGAALNMTGGTISGNIANASQKHSGEGGGVSAVSGSNTAINLEGSCFIRNNRSGEAANNLYLENNLIIRFTGALSADSRIGITMQTPDVFTQALGSSASAQNFTSDDPAYRVLRNSSDQAYLCDVSSAPYQVGDTLQYGTYPQSEVTEAATVAALNAKLKNSGWISYGYYIGTGGSNGEMAPDDFMRYQDVVLDGAKYRAVTFDRYRPSITTVTSSADNSLQDENGYEPGSTYWFRFEPVTWKVLDPDSGLVLCIGAIDAQAYHNYIILDSDNDEYWGNADPVQKYRANDYAHSDIRAWLNEDFINTAFSTAQQENIKVSELDNSFNYSGSTYVYASTSDKIFLLSYSDMTAYIFDPNASAMDEARRMAPSDYAKCQGIVENTTKTSFWWLRTPNSSDSVPTVNPYGMSSVSYTLPCSTSIGVVPALRMQELQDDPTGAPLKVTPEVNVTIDNVTYNSKAIAVISISNNANGTVSVTVKGSGTDTYTYGGTVMNGVASVDLTNLPPDTYTATVDYSGDEASLAPASGTATFTVARATPDMTLTAEPVIYGEDAVITAALPANATGSVIFSLVGSKNTYTFTDASITDGVAQVSQKLNADVYAVTATYSGDGKYLTKTAETTLSVNKAKPAITVTTEPSETRNEIKITVTEPSDAVSDMEILIDIDNDLDSIMDEQFDFTVSADEFEDGVYSFILSKTFDPLFTYQVGNYTIYANYSGNGDDYYTPYSASTTFTISHVHVWGEPTWDWTDDYENPTYTAECSTCADGKITGQVTSTPGDRVEATVEKNAFTPYTASVNLDGQTFTGTFELEEPGTMLAARKAAFEQYKTDQKKAAEDKALDGDSDECAALIEAAKKAIDDVTYDESKPLDENKQAVDAAANLPQLEEKLTDQRAADAVEKKINAIGEVAYTDESKGKIDEARKAYDDLTDAQKALVDNKDTLEKAEDDYQLLDDKNSFEEYKDELIKAAEDMRTDDDSAESKKLIDDTVAAIDAMEYDESKSLDDNKQAVEDAAALDELTEQLEDHRAVYYAVFKADGVEIARVPYTIDTKSIDEPAVPVKDNYTGAWPQYELKEGGVEINAVYVKNDALVITDNAKEQGADRVLTFMETVTFTTDISALPEGATLCWYVNDEAVTAEKSVTVESPKDDYTVQVKAFAKDGTLYTESEALTVKVDHTLWAKIVAVAKLSFTPVFNAMKKVVPSLFSFLIALIKAVATAVVAVVKSVI